MINRLWRRLTAHIDGFLLALLIILMTVGLGVLYSAAAQDITKVIAQMINMAVALTAMWVVANIAPQNLRRLTVPIYCLGLALLIAVAFFGEISHGARRWLHIGVTRIQPSELMKIAVPLMLAWYFDKREATKGLLDFIVATILLMIPVALIAKQPDLGTSLLIAASGFFVLFLAGLSWRVILTVCLILAAAAPILWSHMHDYQRQRVLTLLDPSQDPLGTGYHTIQAGIALGSGGSFGKGWLHGTQAHLDFLPEPTTDFIFAVFSEEFGLAGNILLLLLFLAITARGLVIAIDAPNMFTRLIAGSITLTFFIYAFVNMGMVSGILPIVGVPLPLVSYGGTSLVTLMTGFGILMSINTHKILVKT